MIGLHFWTTNNDYRERTMLEETGLPYNLHPEARPNKEQLAESFKMLHVGHKIPVLVDCEGPGGSIAIPKSPEILRYLAEKTNGSLFPKYPRTKVEMESRFSYGVSTFYKVVKETNRALAA